VGNFDYESMKYFKASFSYPSISPYLNAYSKSEFVNNVEICSNKLFPLMD